MNKIKKIITNILISLVLFISSISIVSADSGLESNYKDDSILGVLIEAFMNCFSLIIKLIATKPGEDDYSTCHIITSIICILLFYIFTCINMFKLDKRKKSSNEVIKLLLIGLIPITIFSLFCLLTKLQLIIYILITIIFIIILKIVFNKIIKNKINKQLIDLKNIDKSFDEEEFNKEAFDIYKNIQLAWSNFKLNDIKDIISSELFDKYEKKLDELKKDNQKNIMDEIEYKSNNIVYATEDEIICEMNVVCYDYIVEEDKVIKGEKDKKYNYLYRLFFNKKNNLYILNNKKLLKTKIVKK